MKETTQSSITLPTPPPVATARKTRTPASTSKPTPKAKSRASKREKKSEKEKEEIKIIEPAPVVQEEKSKINADELKNELLADWLDDDDVKVDKPKISEGKKRFIKIFTLRYSSFFCVFFLRSCRKSRDGKESQDTRKNIGKEYW